MMIYKKAMWKAKKIKLESGSSRRINKLIAIPYRQPIKSPLHTHFTMSMSMNPIRKKIGGGSIIRLSNPGTPLI
jgi:hypothetical protein